MNQSPEKSNYPSKRSIGYHYEQLAASYLEKAGYRILEKNVWYRWGEIDLVVVDREKNELVFVEVRHKGENPMCTPAESISKTKLLRLRRAIDTYLVSPQFERLALKCRGVRVDLMAFDGDRPTHWKNFI